MSIEEDDLLESLSSQLALHTEQNPAQQAGAKPQSACHIPVRPLKPIGYGGQDNTLVRPACIGLSPARVTLICQLPDDGRIVILVRVQWDQNW
jgi:hypothetical protein